MIASADLSLELGEPLIVIGGPTAAGKTALAISLAKSCNGEVVSLDSVQSYRGFDIGSAKPTAQERGEVRHHLIDVYDGLTPGNAAHFLSLAHEAVKDITQRRRRVIVSGGTNLYLTLLLHGIAELPKADPELRARLSLKSDTALHEELAQCDPESAARLHSHDRVRVIRAIEAHALTGQSASAHFKAHAFRHNLYRALCLIPYWRRAKLYERIELRTREMISQGLLAEVQRLRTYLPREAPPFATLGYAQALSVLEGSLPKEDLFQAIAQETRRFAKRQLTFWRNEPAKRGWSLLPKAEEGILLAGAGTQAGQSEPQSLSVYQYHRADLCARVITRLGKPFTANEVWRLDADAL